MNDLPTGIVTLVFTDIEGSTKLLHELGAEAYAERARRTPPAPPRGVHATRRRRDRHAGRRVLLRVRGCARSDRRGRGGLRGTPRRPDPRPSRDPHRARRTSGPRATSARTCISAPGSARPVTAGRSCSPTRRRRSADLEESAPRPRRASPEGLRAAGPDPPARLGALPAAEDDLEHEPAAARRLVRRPRQGGRRGRRADPRRRAARHAHRPWRFRQDAAVDRVRR